MRKLVMIALFGLSFGLAAPAFAFHPAPMGPCQYNAFSDTRYGCGSGYAFGCGPGNAFHPEYTPCCHMPWGYGSIPVVRFSPPCGRYPGYPPYPCVPLRTQGGNVWFDPATTHFNYAGPNPYAPIPQFGGWQQTPVNFIR
jgi:hypothetical protein